MAASYNHEAAAKLAARFGSGATAKAAVQASKAKFSSSNTPAVYSDMFAFEGRSPPAAVQLASQITAPNTAAPAPRDQHPSIQPSTSPSTSLSTFQHRPAPSCSGVRDLELQPFLAPRPPNPHEYLDDNKDFVPTAEGDYDEQLFRSSSPRLVPPMPHTRGSPGNRVHAGDFRFCEPSTDAPAAKFGTSEVDPAHQAPNPRRRQALQPSYTKRTARLEEIVEKGVQHGQLPAERPNSPEAQYAAHARRAAQASARPDSLSRAAPASAQPDSLSRAAQASAQPDSHSRVAGAQVHRDTNNHRDAAAAETGESHRSDTPPVTDTRPKERLVSDTLPGEDIRPKERLVSDKPPVLDKPPVTDTRPKGPFAAARTPSAGTVSRDPKQRRPSVQPHGQPKSQPDAKAAPRKAATGKTDSGFAARHGKKQPAAAGPRSRPGAAHPSTVTGSKAAAAGVPADTASAKANARQLPATSGAQAGVSAHADAQPASEARPAAETGQETGQVPLSGAQSTSVARPAAGTGQVSLSGAQPVSVAIPAAGTGQVPLSGAQPATEVRPAAGTGQAPLSGENAAAATAVEPAQSPATQQQPPEQVASMPADLQDPARSTSPRMHALRDDTSPVTHSLGGDSATRSDADTHGGTGHANITAGTTAGSGGVTDEDIMPLADDRSRDNTAVAVNVRAKSERASQPVETTSATPEATAVPPALEAHPSSTEPQPAALVHTEESEPATLPATEAVPAVILTTRAPVSTSGRAPAVVARVQAVRDGAGPLSAPASQQRKELEGEEMNSEGELGQSEIAASGRRPRTSAVRPQSAGVENHVRRSLSPHGKSLKRHSQSPRTYPRQPLSHVRARYLEDGPPPASDFRRVSHNKYYWWKLGKLYADVPDYKMSQPSTYDTGSCLRTEKEQDIVTLKQVYWSFDEAHPALADVHCLRTKQQDRALMEERAAAEKKLAAARARAMRREASNSSPSVGQGRPAGRPLSQRERAFAAGGNRLRAETKRVSDSAQAAIDRARLLTQRDRTTPGLNSNLATHSEEQEYYGRPVSAAAGWQQRGSSAEGGQMVRPHSAGPGYVSEHHFAYSGTGQHDPEAAHSSASFSPHPPRNQHALADHAAHAHNSRQQTEAQADHLAHAHNYAAPAHTYAAPAHTYAAPAHNSRQQTEGQADHGAHAHSSRHNSQHNLQHISRHQTEAKGYSSEGERKGKYEDEGVREEVSDSEEAEQAENEIATGRFSPGRFEEYTAEMDAEMRERHNAGAALDDMQAGYESDLERDEMAVRAGAAAAALNDLGSAEVDRQREAAMQDAVAAGFADQNRWMDEYRKDVVTRCAEDNLPAPGYFEEVQASNFEDPSPMELTFDGGLSPEELDLLKHALIPRDIGHIARQAIHEAERHTGRCLTPDANGYCSDGANFRRGQGQREAAFRPTKPKEMGFEARAKAWAKPISQVKLEQDLEIQRREQEAAYAFRFVANKVPFKSTKESNGFLEYKAEAEAQAAQERIAARQEQLRAMLGSGAGPFSFCEKDVERQRRKAEMQEKHKKDINRFQVAFKAKPVPKSVTQRRLDVIQAEARMKKEQAKADAADKLARINAEFVTLQGRVAESMAAEMEPFHGTFADNIACQRSGHLRTVDPDVLAAAQAVGLHATIMALPNKYQTVIGAGVHEIGNAEKHLLALARKNYRVRRKLSRQRATDALWNKKHGTKKLGEVPDFDTLHTQWDAKLAKARKEMRKATLTVPEEFNFTKGDPEVQAVRQARAEEKRQRIVIDKLLDDEELPEMRWPFLEARAKVQPTPPPASPPVDTITDTRANRLRRRATQRAQSAGQYELAAERDEMEKGRREEDLRRRAKAHVALERKKARHKLNAAMLAPPTFGGKLPAGDGTAEGPPQSPRIKSFQPEGYEDRLSSAHRLGRYSQVQKDVSAMTRDILLSHGADVLNYVEGPVNPRKIIQDIKASVPASKGQVRQQLSKYNEDLLKQLMHEVHKDWEPSANNPRADAIEKIAAHICSYEL